MYIICVAYNIRLNWTIGSTTSMWSKPLTNSVLVQFSHSVVSDSATPWTAARQASLSITNSQSLLKLMSIKSVLGERNCSRTLGTWGVYGPQVRSPTNFTSLVTQPLPWRCPSQQSSTLGGWFMATPEHFWLLWYWSYYLGMNKHFSHNLPKTVKSQMFDIPGKTKIKNYLRDTDSFLHSLAG